ncbi:uncharacterized protein LOC143114890 isoform X1 [Alosa pseudoharengus]|uniref:uncharacterized protein LOC143114890 isoform X1 n=1 Tax=Alosa pseudoharengus TaxID=34774 RepID=UPI003F8A9661
MERRLTFQGAGSPYGNEMESPIDNPNKAAEYLKELNKIIETQQELLEKQKIRIEELEQQVTELCNENACLKDEYQRHLLTCRLQQGNCHSALGSIQENATQEKLQCENTKMVRRHASLPLEAIESPGSLISPVCRRPFPCRQWKSASFGSQTPWIQLPGVTDLHSSVTSPAVLDAQADGFYCRAQTWPAPSTLSEPPAQMDPLGHLKRKELLTAEPHETFIPGSVDTLHQYCCPPPLFSKQLAVPAPVSECRDDNVLHQFCCPPSGSSSPSR